MFRKFNFTVITGLTAMLLAIGACPSVAANQQQNDQQVSQSGMQLWADNCANCHAMRSPDSYSDTQWDVAVLHMRMRANLTADDANAIAEYLKAAN